MSLLLARLAGLLASTVLLAALTGCGAEDEDADGPGKGPTTATIEQVLRDPEAFDDQPIEVRGEVASVVDAGFVLTNDGSALFVGAPRSDLGSLERGERVTVVGDLETLDDTRAETIEDALDARADTLEDSLPLEIGPGVPLLNLRTYSQAAAG